MYPWANLERQEAMVNGSGRGKEFDASQHPLDMGPRKETTHNGFCVVIPVQEFGDLYVVHSGMPHTIPKDLVPQYIQRATLHAFDYSGWEVARRGLENAGTGFLTDFAYNGIENAGQIMMATLKPEIAKFLASLYQREGYSRGVSSANLWAQGKSSEEILKMESMQKLLVELTDLLKRGNNEKNNEKFLRNMHRLQECQALFVALRGMCHAIRSRLSPQESRKLEEYRSNLFRLVGAGRTMDIVPVYDSSGTLQQVRYEWKVAPDNVDVRYPATSLTFSTPVERAVYSFLRELGRPGEPLKRAAAKVNGEPKTALTR